MHFRDLFDVAGPEGNSPVWPGVFLTLLDETFAGQAGEKSGYPGPEVIINRRDHELNDGPGERPRVQQRYHFCREKSAEVMTIDNEAVWLLGFEIPNQSDRMQRADLVGLKTDGSLVVFEYKEASAGRNSHPLFALIEGLDYLACLHRGPNVEAVQRGIAALKTGHCPDGFEEVSFSPDIRPSVYVAGSQEYWDSSFADTNSRQHGWRELQSVGQSKQFGFKSIVSELESTEATSVQMP